MLRGFGYGAARRETAPVRDIVRCVEAGSVLAEEAAADGLWVVTCGGGEVRGWGPSQPDRFPAAAGLVRSMIGRAGPGGARLH